MPCQCACMGSHQDAHSFFFFFIKGATFFFGGWRVTDGGWRAAVVGGGVRGTARRALAKQAVLDTHTLFFPR